MIVRPYGWALWENIQQALGPALQGYRPSKRSVPLLIPRSFIDKEKHHVEVFARACGGHHWRR